MFLPNPRQCASCYWTPEGASQWKLGLGRGGQKQRRNSIANERDWFFSVYPHLPWNITMVTAPVKMTVYLGHSIKEGAWTCVQKKVNEIKTRIYQV